MTIDDSLSEEELDLKWGRVLGICGTPEEIRQARKKYDECEARNHCDENGDFYDNIVCIPYVGGGLKLTTQCGNCGASYNRQPTLQEIGEYNELMSEVMKT